LTGKGGFLPVSRSEMTERGWYYYDFLVVTGDAYVDHPSFGTAVISRVLEAEGFRVAVLSQPRWETSDNFLDIGKPRFGVFVGAGNLDSMVAHYTAAKRRRREDFYSPGKKTGLRPDRASIVYCNSVRAAFPGVPVILGGIEASLRRFAHYDYWDDTVRRSILLDSKADLLIYGMGETAAIEIARRLKSGEDIKDIRNVRGTVYVRRGGDPLRPLSDFAGREYVTVCSYDDVRRDKRAYAKAAMQEYDEHDAVSGRAVVQLHGDATLVVNPPQPPLPTREFDRIYELPYMRTYHPTYERLGGVPAIEEVRFSIIHNRGCFGACNFCSLAYHQGRTVSVRSHESILSEAKLITEMPDFKGYINDVGGPTANFRKPSCSQQLKRGMCRNRRCLSPAPCPQLEADHRDYLILLRKVKALPGVKKVFIRSGIRFDYLMCDTNGEFFAELVKNHISGQLKVAPEHSQDNVLAYMGKPSNAVYNGFLHKYNKLNERYAKKQYVVPYFISSHPGSQIGDAVALAEYLRDNNIKPEQVQDFYPTPGTLSTCMYHTGIDPRTMEPVFIPRTPKEKAMQRALLQYRLPQNYRLVHDALTAAGRTDLIGFGKKCLIKPFSRPVAATRRPNKLKKT